MDALDIRPAFGVQPPLFHEEPVMIGLVCPHCGFVHETPEAWARERTGHHIGCPNCSHIAAIPRIEP